MRQTCLCALSCYAQCIFSYKLVPKVSKKLFALLRYLIQFCEIRNVYTIIGFFSIPQNFARWWQHWSSYPVISSHSKFSKSALDRRFKSSQNQIWRKSFRAAFQHDNAKNIKDTWSNTVGLKCIFSYFSFSWPLKRNFIVIHTLKNIFLHQMSWLKFKKYHGDSNLWINSHVSVISLAQMPQAFPCRGKKTTPTFRPLIENREHKGQHMVFSLIIFIHINKSYDYTR
jgi:hypothetical protein